CVELEIVRSQRTCGIISEEHRDWYRRQQPLTPQQKAAWDHAVSVAADGYLDFPGHQRVRLEDRVEGGGTRVRSIIIADSTGSVEHTCLAFSVIEQPDGSTFMEYHAAVEENLPDGSIRVVREPST